MDVLYINAYYLYVERLAVRAADGTSVSDGSAPHMSIHIPRTVAIRIFYVTYLAWVMYWVGFAPWKEANAIRQRWRAGVYANSMTHVENPERMSYLLIKDRPEVVEAVETYSKEYDAAQRAGENAAHQLEESRQEWLMSCKDRECRETALRMLHSDMRFEKKSVSAPLEDAAKYKLHIIYANSLTFWDCFKIAQNRSFTRSDPVGLEILLILLSPVILFAAGNWILGVRKPISQKPDVPVQP